MAQSKQTSVMLLKLAEAKRAQCFMRMQNLHNMISQLSDENILMKFLAQASVVDQLRSQFIELLDDVNLLNMELDSEYIVNYKAKDTFDDLYCNVKYQFKKFDSSASNFSPIVARDSIHKTKNESIEIPRIDLSKFDGEIYNFPIFYETFKRAVHNNNSLTDSERSHYLFSHLTGKAKAICSGIIPAAENYATVWQALIAKYDIRRDSNQLLSIEPVNGPSKFNSDKVIDDAATDSAIIQPSFIGSRINEHSEPTTKDTGAANSSSYGTSNGASMCTISASTADNNSAVNHLSTTVVGSKEITFRAVYTADVTSSVTAEPQAVQGTKQLLQLFLRGGSQQAKCLSNSESGLNEIPGELLPSKSVTFDDDATWKPFGFCWYPAVIRFQVSPDGRRCTKRHILSSRLFDDLGLVAPLILYAKLLIKELWLSNLDWDRPPP